MRSITSSVGWRLVLVGLMALSGCATTSVGTPPSIGALRGSAGGTLDSAWVLLERQAVSPPGYGLYTYLLLRQNNRNAARALTEIFVTTVSAGEAALSPANLNLIAIPVRNAAQAAAATSGARAAPAPTAALVLERHYDHGQAANLIAAVCRPERGEAVMRACGATLPDGPLLVTSTRPIDPASPMNSQRMLVVNLGSVNPAAVGEVMESYRRQIRRADFADRAETTHWRLAVLDVLLDAAALLPGISKAYAAGP
jgi:hypothetical protein